MKMKNILKLGILCIVITILLASCKIWPHWIWFENQSSYKIQVKCDVTDPSSFILNPVDGKLKVEYKSSDASSYDDVIVNLKYNDNDLVSASVDSNGWVIFKNK
jgi:hypothetical protein